MKIVADENIPFVEEAFERLGEVHTYPGRELNAQAVKEADILLVRSVTRVDENLLKGNKIRFVATATIGYDHVHTEYLKKEGIGFASAAGSNANSVAEYMVAALLILACRHRFSLSDKTIGVVGVGNVGSRVVEKATILNMKVLQNDPPLARKTREERFRSLEELLEKSDILTLHVPLTYGRSSTSSPLTGGPVLSTFDSLSVNSVEGDEGGGERQDPTFHMANDTLFSKMKDGSFFINTSRGAVVDSPSLLKALKSKKLAGAVLDVWEGEPEISKELLLEVDLGTPHIAGYSFDGKTNATIMIYRSACDFLNMKCDWQPSGLPPPCCPKIETDGRERKDEEIISEVVQKAYDLERDDRALRQMLEIASSKRKQLFDRLRSEYPVRREFRSIEVNVNRANKRVTEKLKALGFKVQE